MVVLRGDGKKLRANLADHGKLKGGGGAVGIWACSSTANGRDRKSVWIIGVLVWRQVTPRWVNDLVWQL